MENKFLNIPMQMIELKLIMFYVKHDTNFDISNNLKTIEEINKERFILNRYRMIFVSEFSVKFIMSSNC